MSSVSGAVPQVGNGPGILAKERIVAAAGFNRWLVPPAALCMHLCIGMACGFGVFSLQFSKAIGITKSVGLLTAWSVAGIIGPVLINYIREFQLAHGVSKALAYDITMYILVGLLLLGLICNALVKPVAEKHYMSEAELAAELKKAHESGVVAADAAAPVASGLSPAVIGAWFFVGIPLAWGIWTTLLKARALF